MRNFIHQILIFFIFLILKVFSQQSLDEIEEIKHLENILKNIQINNETNLTDLPIIKTIDKYVNLSDFIENIDLTSILAKEVKSYINKIKESDSDYYNNNIFFFENIINQLELIENSYSFEEKMTIMKSTINEMRNKLNKQEEINALFSETINNTFDNLENFLKYYELKRKQKLNNISNLNNSNNITENISINYFNNSDFKGFNSKTADIFMLFIIIILALSLIIIGYYYIKEKIIVMKLGGENNFKKIQYYTNRKENQTFIKVPLNFYTKEIEMVNISSSSSQNDGSTLSS